MAKQVLLPERLNASGSIGFIDALYAYPEQEMYEFDFKNVKWMEPFALLYLSYHLAIFRHSKPACHFVASNVGNNYATSYASHMGFFRAFGLDFGKHPGEARGSESYIPITIMNVEDLEREAYDECLEVGDVLQRRCRELACVLTRQNDGPLIDILEFSLREMFRNVVEHSGARQIGFCAQYWPTRRRVELAILDNGMGLWESLKPNRYLKIESHKDAINYALLPGISGKAYKGAPKQISSAYSNSGFGLYMTSEICRNGGDFFVCSGESGVLLKGVQKRNVGASLRGTAVRLVLDTESVGTLQQSIDSFIAKGRTIASALKGAIIEPSYASTMLARDFR
jgi:hypothetical protein